MTKNIKVLNIATYIPVKGFPKENDINLKIYHNLFEKHCVDSLFIKPINHIPNWAKYIREDIKQRYNLINSDTYKDKNYNIPIRFFQAYFPIRIFKNNQIFQYYYLAFCYYFYGKNIISSYKAFQPDIIHAHNVRDAFHAYKLSKKFNVPYIITLRGAYSKLYETKLVKKIMNNASVLITPSYKLYSILNLCYSIKLLGHGLDSIWFNNFNKKFCQQKLRLISVCRLLDWKNIELVLKIVAGIKREGYKIHYTIVGDGPNSENLKNLSIDLEIQNEVSFLGHKPMEEIKNIYDSNDIFILLSHPETFGRVFFEAAAQGLLIIGLKDTGAFGHLTQEEGFFIEASVSDGVKALKGINEDVFYEITERSRRKAESFDNELIIDKYYSILNKIVK